MTVYLTVDQVVAIHAEVIRLHGGDGTIIDLGLVDSAVALPRAGFGGHEFYPTLVEKAAAMGFSLSLNHGFKDGNKRTGFTAMDVFLRLNGSKVVAPVAEAEAVGLAVAAHRMSREQFTDWVRKHVVPV
jgi:death-on-curing protein